MREFPRSFDFIGKRVVRDIYEQLERTRPKWKLDLVNFTPPVIPFEFGARRSEPTEANMYWIARKVTEAIADHTGTILDPGTYVRAEMHFRWAAVSFELTGEEIAWLYGTGQTEEGEAHVILVGSVENFVGYAPKGANEWLGWKPSSTPGTSRAIQWALQNSRDRQRPARPGGEVESLAGTNGSVLRSWEITPPSGYSIDPHVLQEALYLSLILSEHGHVDGANRKEVLFRVGECGGPFRTSSDNPTLGRVYVGTPLWVADPVPRRDRRLMSDRS
ncbi:DUF7019 family protein [Actinoplanes solisilvae]|uniref:DUF7019 family protein n=1 Tax=Actinoplanes solisilvae TaxID=2486853 RepID=UPI000FDCD5B0|nr:hypothetical protein [Actinoplanes solisilvae]